MRKEENNMEDECIALFSKKVYNMLRNRFKNCYIQMDYDEYDNVLHIIIRFYNGLVYAQDVANPLGQIFEGLQAYQLVTSITRECRQEILKYYFR